MNKRLFSHIFLFILSLPLLGKAQTPVAEKGLLYEVSGNGLKKPSYLFGTFHLLKSDFLKEIPKLESCFNKAKGVVVEVDIQGADIMTITNAMMMKGQKLTDLLTPEEANKLDDKLQVTTGTNLAVYNNMKPNAVMVTLSTQMPPDVEAQLNKYDGTLMDLYFMEQAREKKKTVTGLESATEQANLLFGDSIPKQVELLKKYITKMDEADTITAKLADAYFAQDMDGMYALSMKTGDITPGDMEGLLFKRNRNWLKVLPALFEKEPQFVAVGALHLAGEEGLVNQLRKMGYTVKAVR